MLNKEFYSATQAKINMHLPICKAGFAETIAPSFACLGRQMGYDDKPIGPDLTIVTVGLRYGVFPRDYDAPECYGYFVTDT